MAAAGSAAELVAQTRPQADDYAYLFKMLLVGDPSVGKSSLLLRFVDDVYTGRYETTIGVDFKTRTTSIGESRVKLNIWDTSGEERFRSVTSGYYRGAHGVIIVYDVTVRESFNNVRYWSDEVNKFAPAEVSTLLVGNKCDLDDTRQVSQEEAARFADELGMQYVETSALTSHNVGTAFNDLAADIKAHVVQRQANREEPTDNQVPDRRPVTVGPAVRVRRGCCQR